MKRVIFITLSIFLSFTVLLSFNTVRALDNTQNNNAQLVELYASKEELENKEISLKVEKNQEFMSNGFSQRYYELENELKNVNAELTDIENKINKIKNSDVLDDFKNNNDDTTDLITENEHNNDDTTDLITENEHNNEFIYFIPFIIFGIAFVVIVVSVIFSAKSGGSFSTNSTKDMLNDLSDVAVKMAKDLNPSYEEFKCPNCGSPLSAENEDVKKCSYCGASLYRTVNKNKRK